MPAILLTRPAAAAEIFADQLRAHLGQVEIVISPLIEIEWAACLPPDIHATPIFTSRNGVEGFTRAGGVAIGPCWCVGDATARAAREAGFIPRSASGDANALISAILKSGDTGPFLHLRGHHARGDVAQMLTRAERRARDAVIYHQRRRDLSAEALALLRRETPVVLPLFSPRTAAQFACAHRGSAPLFVAVMSQAVAAEVTSLPVAELAVAKAPDAGEMLISVGRLINAAQRLEGGPGAK